MRAGDAKGSREPSGYSLGLMMDCEGCHMPKGHIRFS